ncbi:MAG TPA: SDR family oxidoreductase [Anaerolineaceae bacterium]|nr:SDR family oxidoreductase [Anaerolineaceae bacterium]
MEQTFQNKLVLITGGSSGIGLATARAFARQGSNVWILSRNADRLSAALKTIEADRIGSSQSFGCLTADVANADQVIPVIHDFIHSVGTPDYLINSAGVAEPGYVEEQDLAVFRQMMEINYFGTVHAIRAVVPAMLARKSGHIVNFCSIAGIIGIYGYSSYGASKFAVKGFSDTLRLELKHYGIHVTLVIPADTDTPQLEYENKFKPAETLALEKAGGASRPLLPEQVASDILKGISRNKQTVLPGVDAKWMYVAANVVGVWAYQIMDFLMGQAWKKVPNPHQPAPWNGSHPGSD